MLDEADDLYGLPLDEFTAARDALAKRLRGEKRREDADAVKALKRPSVAAGAINLAVREHGADDLLAAGEELRAAHAALLDGSGDAAAVREATAREREAVREFARLALGDDASSATEDKVRATLHAASVDDDVRELLEAGRLERDAEAGVDAMALMAAKAAPKSAQVRPAASPRFRRAASDLPARGKSADGGKRSGARQGASGGKSKASSARGKSDAEKRREAAAARAQAAAEEAVAAAQEAEERAEAARERARGGGGGGAQGARGRRGPRGPGAPGPPRGQGGRGRRRAPPHRGPPGGQDRRVARLVLVGPASSSSRAPPRRALPRLLVLLVFGDPLVVLPQRLARVVDVGPRPLGHQRHLHDRAADALAGEHVVEERRRRRRAPISRVMLSSSPFGRRSPARRSQTRVPDVVGVLTESTPSSETPRRMNGKTVVSSEVPPVRPLAATAPP